MNKTVILHVKIMICHLIGLNLLFKSMQLTFFILFIKAN